MVVATVAVAANGGRDSGGGSEWRYLQWRYRRTVASVAVAEFEGSDSIATVAVTFTIKSRFLKPSLCG